MPNVEWLLHDATSRTPIPVSTVTSLNNEAWRADFERLEIGPGLIIYLSSVEARREVTVEPRNQQTYQWLGSQVTISGRTEIDFRDGCVTFASPEQALLFRPSQGPAWFRLAAGERFRSVGYGLAIERVARLFDNDVPAALSTLLVVAPPPATRILIMASTRTMRALATSLFTKGLNGPLRFLMMEGAVLQLLAAQARSGERPRRTSSELKSQDRDRVHAARARLLADMRAPPTLGTLAAEVGMTEKRLNAGFRSIFGTTVFETLRNERLEHARHALATEDVLLKDVAHRVGYNHVTNFINAFRAQFGSSPRKYVRR